MFFFLLIKIVCNIIQKEENAQKAHERSSQENNKSITKRIITFLHVNVISFKPQFCVSLMW